jgi:hypothetical protein
VRHAGRNYDQVSGGHRVPLLSYRIYGAAFQHEEHFVHCRVLMKPDFRNFTESGHCYLCDVRDDAGPQKNLLQRSVVVPHGLDLPFSGSH